jgi:hypothetical protein
MPNEKRMIDANALKELIYRRSNNLRDGWTAPAVLLAVECQPTVDALPVVHGHKVVRERYRGVARYIPCPCCGSAVPGNKPYTEKVEYCSVCGKRLDDTFQNYCPNCGAKMDGGNEDGC